MSIYPQTRRTVMDIKEIALKLLAKEFPGMRQENQVLYCKESYEQIKEMLK